jgi:hypothetical protein
MKNSLLFSCGLLVSAVSALAGTASLPDGLDWPGQPSLFPTLQRISTRSGVSLPRQEWPLSVGEIRQFLDKASKQITFTPADSLALQEFLTGPQELKRWTRSDDGTFLAIEPVVSGSMRRDSSLTRRLGTIGGTDYGTLGGEIQWYTQAYIATEWADKYIYYDRYQDPDGEPSEVPFGDKTENGLFEKRTFARYVAWAQWQHSWLTLKYGRDNVQFGPGEWTGLTVSRFAAPNTLFDLRIDPFPWLSVQSTTMQLLPSDVQGGTSLPTWFPGDCRKWMHIQRFEIRPFDGVAVAFQNQVVYPDSGGLEPEYLLPLVPIFFTQDLAGNGPNAAMQFDARIDRIPDLSLWGVFLIDDLDGPTTMFNDHWLNRWAALAGFRLTSPFAGFDADLTGEISVVRPWTFTEERTNGATFASYGLPLGTEGGPDSRSLHLRALWRPNRLLEIGPEFDLQEKGIGRQATLGALHDDSDGNTATLLANEWTTRTVSLHASVEPWLGKRLDLSIGHAWSDSSRYAGMTWSVGGTVGW